MIDALKVIGFALLCGTTAGVLSIPFAQAYARKRIPTVSRRSDAVSEIAGAIGFGVALLVGVVFVGRALW